MKHITLLIKPASSLCNLRCKYCFYADIADIRDVTSYGFMTEETASTLIDRVFSDIDPYGSVSFLFQGGEPTLAGLPFFKLFISLVHARCPHNVHVQYAIQTNGFVIDDAWADFFNVNNFLVGISIDGYRELHDLLRLDASGRDTYSRIKKNIALLLKKGVEVNLLCVVTGLCARHPEKAYSALKKLNCGSIQFIPCLDPLESPRGSSAYSLLPDAYGQFLCVLFDQWFRDWEQGKYVSIRLFDDYVHLAMGLGASSCSTSGGCGSYFVVEGDGSIFPCDFYVLDKWYMGNIHDNTFSELAASSTAQTFLSEGSLRPGECNACPYLHLCNGGCRRDWTQSLKDGPHNYYCSAFKRFFDHAAARIRYIAQCEAHILGS